MTPLTEKIAVVTGASCGIGRASALLVAHEGAEDVVDTAVIAVTQPPESRIIMIGMRPMLEPL